MVPSKGPVCPPIASLARSLLCGYRARDTREPGSLARRPSSPHGDRGLGPGEIFAGDPQLERGSALLDRVKEALKYDAPVDAHPEAPLAQVLVAKVHQGAVGLVHAVQALDAGAPGEHVSPEAQLLQHMNARGLERDARRNRSWLPERRRDPE